MLLKSFKYFMGNNTMNLCYKNKTVLSRRTIVMKKKIWSTYNQKCLGLMLLAFIMLSILPMQKVKADGREIRIKNNAQIAVLCSAEDKKIGYWGYMDDFSLSDLKNVKVVSSNSSVVSVAYPRKDWIFNIYPKKVGKAKITITGTLGKKKIKRVATISVVNFQNPFTKLNIGGKNYLSKIKSSRNYDTMKIGPETTNIKLQYKLKSGWEIASGSSVNVTRMGVEKKEKVKNGKTYLAPRPEQVLNESGTMYIGDGLYIRMLLKNKRTGADLWFELSVQQQNYTYTRKY